MANEENVWGLNSQDWQNVTYALGNMGQQMLKGTNNEWLAGPGAVAAGMAKNSQADAANKEFTDLLRGVNSPNVKGATLTTKPDGSKTYKVDSHAFDPNSLLSQMPNFAAQVQQNPLQPVQTAQTPQVPQASQTPVTQGTSSNPILSALSQQLGLGVGGQNFQEAWSL